MSTGWTEQGPEIQLRVQCSAIQNVRSKITSDMTELHTRVLQNGSIDDILLTLRVLYSLVKLVPKFDLLGLQDQSQVQGQAVKIEVILPL